MRGREWMLGGPGKFARAIADDLGEGRSVTVVVPSKGVPNGLRAALRDLLPELTVQHLDVTRLTDSRQRVVDGLFDVLGLTRPRAERVRVDDLSKHPDLGRRLLWVDCRAASAAQAEAWGTFLKHYVAAVADLPPYERTVISTLCMGSQAASMPDTDRLVSKRWWWGVLGPLDTAVFVSELLDGDRRLPGFADVVTEVAGFDLDVASMLIESWDGDVSHLRSLLAEYDKSLFDSGWFAVGGASPAARPSPDVMSAWSRGSVNAWGESDPHPHPCHVCAASPAAVQRLVWRGQVRNLMPRIELERQQLASWVFGRRDLLPPEWAGEDIMGLEVGGLSTLLNAVPELVRRDRHVVDRAEWLRFARNRIAHLEILDRRDLERAAQIFGQPLAQLG